MATVLSVGNAERGCSIKFSDDYEEWAYRHGRSLAETGDQPNSMHPRLVPFMKQGFADRRAEMRQAGISNPIPWHQRLRPDASSDTFYAAADSAERQRAWQEEARQRQNANEQRRRRSDIVDSYLRTSNGGSDG